MRLLKARGEINKRWSKVTDPTTLTGRRISRLRPLEWEAHFSQDLPRYQTSFGFDLLVFDFLALCSAISTAKRISSPSVALK